MKGIINLQELLSEFSIFSGLSLQQISPFVTYIKKHNHEKNETIINDKTGFLFEAGSALSLSKKIIEVLQLDETTLKSMGIEGRKNVIKKFNVEKMCFSTYAEYKKLLN